jgi:predicted restriction endonuclease
MKLCNLASLDPFHQDRGVKGLRSSSRADQEVWSEFTSDWDRYGLESEEMLQELLAKELKAEVEANIRRVTIKTPGKEPPGATEAISATKVRLGQRFFRESVLSAYNCNCCITGNPIPELLVASHIVPWKDNTEHRLNPRNGLCLAQTQDAAFDRGLITFDEDFRLVLGPYLREFLPNEALEQNFLAYEGRKIDKKGPRGRVYKIQKMPLTTFSISI